MKATAIFTFLIRSKPKEFDKKFLFQSGQMTVTLELLDKVPSFEYGCERERRVSYTLLTCHIIYW